MSESDTDDHEKKVRRRKHRSRKRRSRSRERNGHSKGLSESEKSRSKKKLNVAALDVNMEDEEALDFDPTKDPNDKFSESHRALKDDPRIVEEAMQENIFSLIFVAPVCSGAFWFGLCVALFQLALPFLALLDLIVLNDDEGNVLQLPNNVPIQVRVLAGMVLILAVVQFWDLMEAVEKLQKGPPPKNSDTPEGAKAWKFYLSYFIQFLMGALFEVAVFVFIVQSTTILDVFLNFAALEFITSVDEFAFKLAQRGYVSNAVKQACDEVRETKILRRKGGRICRRIQIIFFGLLMVGSYALMANWQDRGTYDCEKIEVQFGDGFITILPVFSGVYTYNKQNPGPDDKREGRPVYWDQRRGAAFRYCRKGDSGIFSFANAGFWVFNIILDEVKTLDDMCDNFVSRSPDTKRFDLLEFPGRTWSTKRKLKDSVEYAADFFQLRCADCKDETCNGKCISGECVCEANQYGFNCQFSDPPCLKTDYDRRTAPFKGVGSNFSSKFELLRKGDGTAYYSYNRPVYSFVHDDGALDLLINFGRRFFIFDVDGTRVNGAVQGYKKDDEGNDNPKHPIVNQTIVAEYFTNFHPWYSWIKPLYADGGIVNVTADTELFRLPVFASDPIDVGTQSDSLSPLGLQWRRVQRLLLSKKNYFNLFLVGTPVETVLLCSRCSESSPCLNGGTCLPNNRTCVCPTAQDLFEDDDPYQSDLIYGGTLCEVDCTEDGSETNEACQEDFNPYDDDFNFNFFGDDDYFGGISFDDGPSDNEFNDDGLDAPLNDDVDEDLGDENGGDDAPLNDDFDENGNDVEPASNVFLMDIRERFP